jgi:heme o synthase
MRLLPSLKIASELGKVPISLPVALSALTGYCMYSGAIGWDGRILFLGVLLMSCASGALNQFQEKDIDALMPRTQNRPIPSKRISPVSVLWIAGGFALTGSVILLAALPVTALIISWITIFWYNLVYTPLKRISAFAVVPGSVTGALPPLIGWVAAGGNLFSENILLVSAFFFLGQIPHFWLLLLLFGDEYSLAGLPNLKKIMNESQIRRITFAWIITAMASAFIVMWLMVKVQTLLFMLLFYLFYLLLSLSLSFFAEKELRIRSVFIKLNLLYLFMMIFLIADSLLRN